MSFMSVSRVLDSILVLHTEWLVEAYFFVHSSGYKSSVIITKGFSNKESSSLHPIGMVQF